MSIFVMAAVFQSGLNKAEKMIALAYADHADDFGYNIYPSVGYTAWKTGYSKRSVHAATQKLIEKGILVPDGISPFNTNQYRFLIEKLPKREPYKGGAKISGGAIHDTKVEIHDTDQEIDDKKPAPIAPKPSVNNHENNHLLSETADVISYYQNKIEQLTPITSSKLNTAIEQYPETWLIESIDIASKKGKRSWAYVNGILKNWQLNGKQDELPKSNGKQPLPDNLNTSMFKAVWEKWQVHMKEKGRTLTPTSSEMQLQELSEWGEDRAIAAINLSVRKGWLSINEKNKKRESEENIEFLPGR